MSDDIVERLRDEVKGRVPVWRDRLEAADEIERLREEITRLSGVRHGELSEPALRANKRPWETWEDR